MERTAAIMFVATVFAATIDAAAQDARPHHSIPQRSAEQSMWSLSQAGTAVADRVVSTGPAGTGYNADLALEGLLEFSAAMRAPAYRHDVLKKLVDRKLTPTTSISWNHQPFSCLTFEVSRATHDDAWLPVFLEQSKRCRMEILRSPEGGILHSRGASRGGGEALLIDALGEYIARMAQAGAISGEPEYFRECADQLDIYAAIVRDPVSGLWAQGRGWIGESPEKLSPGAWSRGHGWLIRGMERSLRWLPPESDEFRRVQEHLRKLADALLAKQTQSGLWPCLLHRPPHESPLETSGSAMIACHLARAWQAGCLPDEKYKSAALRAFAALPGFVSPEGIVFSVSPGPGPLESEEPWLVQSYPPDDPHGTFAILFAAAAERRLAEHTVRVSPPATDITDQQR